jgi:hypothetical protein
MFFLIVKVMKIWMTSLIVNFDPCIFPELELFINKRNLPGCKTVKVMKNKIKKSIYFPRLRALHQQQKLT